MRGEKCEMRNAVKQARIGQNMIKDNQDLAIFELKQIFNIYDSTAKSDGHLEGLWNAVSTAYYMGYAVGVRTSKS